MLGNKALSVAVSKLTVPRSQVSLYLEYSRTHFGSQIGIRVANISGRLNRRLRTPFFFVLFCFSVAFLVTQSLDRLSLACAKAWGLATSPCFSHDDRGAIVKVMEILSLHRHSGDRPSYRVELRVFGSLFAIQKYRTPFLFPCSGECWYAVAVEIFKLARLLPLLQAFFPQLLYFTLNLTRLGVYCEGGEGAHSNAPLLS